MSDAPDKPEAGKSSTQSSPPAAASSSPATATAAAASSSAASAPGPAAGETFGQYLLRERELRGLSLQQVSDTTRILAGNLKALEADDLDRLPARVFVLGYIRAYARPSGSPGRGGAALRGAGPEGGPGARRGGRGAAALAHRRSLAALVAAAVAVALAVAWLLTR
jgi:hypothetical protein